MLCTAAQVYVNMSDSRSKKFFCRHVFSKFSNYLSFAKNFGRGKPKREVRKGTQVLSYEGGNLWWQQVIESEALITERGGSCAARDQGHRGTVSYSNSVSLVMSVGAR